MISIAESSTTTFLNGITVETFKDSVGEIYVNTTGLCAILGITILSLKNKYNITKEYYTSTEVTMFARQEYSDGNEFGINHLINQFATSEIIGKIFRGDISLAERSISHKQWSEEVLKDLTPLTAKVSYKLSEKNVQDRLSKRLGFATEVSTPIGRVDMLGDDILCEIKTASQWKHGLGQLCGYSQYYLTHKLYLCLFDINKSTDIKTIKKVCKEFGVVVVNDHFKLL